MAREARRVVICSHGDGLIRLQPMNHDRATQARGVIRVECNWCRRCPACVAVDKRSGDLRGLRPPLSCDSLATELWRSTTTGIFATFEWVDLHCKSPSPV